MSLTSKTTLQCNEAALEYKNGTTGYGLGFTVLNMAHLWPFCYKYGVYGPVLRNQGPYYGPRVLGLIELEVVRHGLFV